MTIRFKPYTVSGIVRLYLKETGPQNSDQPIHKNLFIIHLKLAEVHTEVQTTLAKYLLDLSQGLLTKVAELHQVFLLVGHEFAKAVDLGGFQTVEGADGKVQVFQRSLQDLAELQGLLVHQVFLLLLFIVESDVLVGDDHQMLDQDTR